MAGQVGEALALSENVSAKALRDYERLPRAENVHDVADDDPPSALDCYQEDVHLGIDVRLNSRALAEDYEVHVQVRAGESPHRARTAPPPEKLAQIYVGGLTAGVLGQFDNSTKQARQGSRQR